MILLSLHIVFADMFENIAGAIFVILWIAAQLFSGRQEAKRKNKPRPRPVNPEPVQAADGGLPRPRNQEEALRSEVEDFLRRAQGKAEKPRPVRERPTTLQPKPVQSQVAQPSTRRQHSAPRPAEAARRPDPAPRMPRPDSAGTSPTMPTSEPRALRSEGVAEHVARHLSTQDIADHTRTLGAKVATSDDRLESRLQEKFDHDVGRLGSRDAPGETKASRDDVADQIAAMLRSPEGMRQLIVANEILRRPEL